MCLVSGLDTFNPEFQEPGIVALPSSVPDMGAFNKYVTLKIDILTPTPPCNLT